MKYLDDVDLVYFVQAVEVPSRLIRIGMTRHFTQRLSTLCAENGSQLIVLGVQLAADAVQLERRLHKTFDACRHHGEWFHPTGAILQHIADEATAPEKAHADFVKFNDIDVDTLLDARLPRLLTIEEMARELRVTPMTVRRHVKGRNLPCVRVGGQLRFDMSDLIRDAHVRPRVWAI